MHVIAAPDDWRNVRLASGKCNNETRAGLLRYRLEREYLPTEGVDLSAWNPDTADSEGVEVRTAQRCEWLPAEVGDEDITADEQFVIDRKTRRAMEAENKPQKDTETSRALAFLDAVFQGGKTVIEKNEIDRLWKSQGGNTANLSRPFKRKGLKATRVSIPDEPQFSVWHLPSVKVTSEGIATTDTGEAITITRHNPLGCRTVRRPVPKED